MSNTLALQVQSPKQCLTLYRLPQEVLDLILEHVLHDMVVEIPESEQLVYVHIDEAILASSNSFVYPNHNAGLLKLKPPNGNMFLRYATLAFAKFSNGGVHLKAVCHLAVTREQLESECLSAGPACLDMLESLRTLTVRETMRAGANSATMRSVKFRLEADYLLRWIAGLGGRVFDAEGSEKLRFLSRTGQRLKLILQLKVETWMPFPLMYCEASICDGMFLRFDALSDKEEWRGVLVNGLGYRGPPRMEIRSLD